MSRLDFFEGYLKALEASYLSHVGSLSHNSSTFNCSKCSLFKRKIKVYLEKIQLVKENRG